MYGLQEVVARNIGGKLEHVVEMKLGLIDDDERRVRQAGYA